MNDDSEKRKKSMKLPGTPENTRPHMSDGPVTITPEQANDLLGRGGDNRKLSEIVVDRYAAALKAGEWEVTGDPIRLSVTGQVLDGQHRLWACVMTDIALETYIYYNVPEEAWDLIDTGKARSLKDHFDKYGEKSTALLAATMSKIHQYEEEDYTFRNGVRTPQAQAKLENFPEIRDSVAFVAGLSISPVVTASIAATIHYLASDTGAANEFWLQVAKGDMLANTSPALRLRDRLIRAKIVQKRFTRTEEFAMCVKAYNAFSRGQEMRALRFGKSEPFPQVR